MKARKIIVDVVVISAITIAVILLNYASTGNAFWQKGELIETKNSPDGHYAVNSYLNLGNATVANSVKCEVVDNYTGEKRNIYYEYRCKTVEINWIDDITVVINGKVINVITGSYDSEKRNNICDQLI